MKNPYHYSSSSHLFDLADRAKVRNNPTFQKLAYAASITKNPGLVNAVTRILEQKAAYEDIIQIPFEHPGKDTIDLQFSNEKKILLGAISQIRQFFFCPINWFAAHMLVVGSSGSGKTTLFRTTLPQFLLYKIPFIAIDYLKQDYRRLATKFKELIILKAGKDYIVNPLQVPTGVVPEDWRSLFVVNFCKANGLLDGSENLLNIAVTELYEQLGVFRGSDYYPSLVDLYNKIKSYNLRGNYRESQFQQSLCNRLGAYKLVLGETAEYNQGLPVEWLKSTPLVIEFKALSERMARFMVTNLLFSIFMHRIAISERGNCIRNFFLIDEAAAFAPKGLTNDTQGISNMEIILNQAREAGIGITLGTQSLQNLDRAILKNSAVKVAMHLGDGEDIEQAKRSFALTQEQSEYISQMDIGEAIVRIRKEKPFLINTFPSAFN